MAARTVSRWAGRSGVPLLEHAGRRVALTPAGTVLVRYAESVLATLEEASAALAATRASLAGPLRIGAFPTAARTILPPVLITLGRDHPGLEFMVTELDPVAVPDALRAGTPLRAGGGTPAESSVRDWRDAAWIAGSPDTMCHTMMVRACQARGFTPRVRHYADDFATVLALVAAGQGVSLVPQLSVTGTPPGVTLHPQASRRRVRIAYRKGTRDHPIVSAFAAAIHESAAVTLGRPP